MINELTPTTNGWETYKKLLRMAQPYWKIFLLGVIGTILASAADGLLSWMIKPIIDKGIVPHNKTFITWIAIIMIVGFIIRGATLFMSNYFISKVGRSVVRDLREKIFAHLMKLPATFYDKESSGQLLSLVLYNTDQVASGIIEGMLTILQEGLLLIALVTVMLVINWKLTILLMLITPVMAVIIRYTNTRLRMLNTRVQKTVGNIAHIAEEGILGYKVIRIFGGEHYETEKFNKMASFNRNSEMKVVATNSIGTSIIQILATIPIAIILYIITIFNMTVGGFGAIFAAMARLLTPIKRLTKINTDIQRGIAAAASIFNVLEHPPENDTGTLTLDRALGKIEYNDVQFKYPNSHKNVLRNLSFMVEPGKTVAIVGRSGGGKSTLVSLLPRFYDVTHGEILLDGININEYKLKDLRRQFALVSQSVVLFNDTIAKNVAYGRFDYVSKEEIIKALDAAYLTEFVNQLPDGLETMIGENGLLLSGGQRQRLAIARAILKNAPILILDEATSALDTESEHYIQAALDNLMKERTTLVIAHRLSTIEKADKIIVIENGHIFESGTHHELLETSGQYAKLYKMQFKESKSKV